MVRKRVNLIIMAVFESRKSVKLNIDDTQVLSCVIEGAQNIKGHTAYLLRVQRGYTAENSWRLSRRYSDFDALNTSLQPAGIEVLFPPKKVFGNMGREFIAERQQGLQAYINAVLAHPMLANSLPVKRFLDPDKYSSNFAEIALQHVSMVFRSECRWKIVEPLPDMGWRLRKQYFLIKPEGETKERLVLSWVSLGPDYYLVHKDLQSAIKLLVGLQHPYIYPITFASVRESGCLVVRNLEENGTLRDLMCKSKPKTSFLKKYINPKIVCPVPTHLIKKFGRQILEVLKFLHDKGLFHGHLHSGNIIISNEMCKLLEVENQLLGLPAYLRPNFTQLRKIQTLQNVDVYSFGHLMYEMMCGSPCLTPTCNSFPQECSTELRTILETTISTEACKKIGLPSISDLLAHPFFANLSNTEQEKFHLKVPAQLRENLCRAKEQIESKIEEEQKSFRHYQRLSKVKSQLMSVERKKQLNERKKQQKLATTNTTSSLSSSTTVQNGPSKSRSEDSSDTPKVLPSPPPPPPPEFLISPLNPISRNGPPSCGSDRKALLGSIECFNKGKLKNTATKDCSMPKV